MIRTWAIPNLVISASILAVGLFLPGASSAQIGGGLGQSRVKISCSFEPAEASPGDSVELLIEAKIQSGYHIYALTQPEGAIPRPTKIEITDWAGLLEEKPFSESAPIPHMGEFTGEYNYHENQVVFRARVSVPKEIEPGEIEIRGTIGTMACTWEFCDPPKSDAWSARLTIVAAAMTPVATQVETDVSGAEPAPNKNADGNTSIGKEPGSEDRGKAQAHEEEEEEGLLGLILVAVVAGFAALATPCVFPMIPITVSFFAKQSEQEGSNIVLLASAYAIGIVVSFTGFGLILAAVKGATGAQEFASNPFVNLGIATVFIVFALNLFGLFELRIPTRLVNRLDKVGRGKTNLIAVMFMGFTFTLAAFTCTMPFMGAVLAKAAEGEAVRPIIGMMFFSGAFALPFFFLALFPSLLTSMRKRTGGWMHQVKVTMGFIELAAAFKFLSNADLIWSWGILTRPVVLVSWIGIFGLTGIYLLGFFRMADEPPVEGLGAVRMLFALFFVSVTLYLGTGLGGQPLGGLVDAYLPPMHYPGMAGVRESAGGSAAATSRRDGDATKGGHLKHANLPWIEDLDEALVLAKSQGSNLFVNFTGDT